MYNIEFEMQVKLKRKTKSQSKANILDLKQIKIPTRLTPQNHRQARLSIIRIQYF
jgi:hypothetical protein